ncbi:MAG: hypothetical protein GY862_18995 [Gammaproteobacteria bacterium]|nr:hypothetical protein [Gammaproteobacteria bacterium]
MQITLTLPDELTHQIQVLPDSDSFVREALQAAIQQRKAGKPLSKWAKIVRHIEEKPVELDDYAEKFKQDDGSLAQSVKLYSVLLFFQSAQLSRGAACEFAGVDIYTFLAACKLT